MKGLIHKNGVYISKKDFIDKEYVMSIGISQIQGYAPIHFYLRGPRFVDLSFKIESHKSKNKCQLIYSNMQHPDNPIWMGMPYDLSIVKLLNGEDFIELSKWLDNYRKDILLETYVFMDMKFDQSQIKTASMSIYNLKSISNGVQINGYIKDGDRDSISKYSVNFSILINRLPNKPMIGRVGDNRVGYFYDRMYLDVKDHIAGEPIVIINKKDLKKSPWTYVVDKSVPKEYHHAIKRGILSWNMYFKKLGLGKPFKVFNLHDSDYPKDVDVFDGRYWYIMATEVENFNGPYSGFSIYTTDYRSGEILFGMVSLNLLKIASIPARYLSMNRVKDQKLIKSSIENYLSWITAHEVGHQLGLRHNFMGNMSSEGFGSIMDYMDVFNNFINLNFLDIEDIGRDYDLKAIKYGYTHLKDEQTGVKHPELDKIAGQKVSFGTDENFYEGINPFIGPYENTSKALEYVENMITILSNQRKNLISAVKSGELSTYEYNTMFIYLYTSKYLDLVSVCLKFIGGRVYDDDRTHYSEISEEMTVDSLRLIMKVLENIQYTKDEYAYVVYDYTTIDNLQDYNRLKLDSYYNMNVKNLFSFYQNIIQNVFNNLLNENRLIRLDQNYVSDFNSSDLLINFTFAFRGGLDSQPYSITDYDGVFPEIGALLISHSSWQEILLRIDPLRFNQQYTWVKSICQKFKLTKYYSLKSTLYLIMANLHQSINEHVLPYIDTLSDHKGHSKNVFWKHPRSQLINHWSLLENYLQQQLQDVRFVNPSQRSHNQKN